jgi:hypothetical protein
VRWKTKAQIKETVMRSIFAVLLVALVFSLFGCGSGGGVASRTFFMSMQWLPSDPVIPLSTAQSVKLVIRGTGGNDPDVTVLANRPTPGSTVTASRQVHTFDVVYYSQPNQTGTILGTNNKAINLDTIPSTSLGVVNFQPFFF